MSRSLHFIELLVDAALQGQATAARQCCHQQVGALLGVIRQAGADLQGQGQFVGELLTQERICAQHRGERGALILGERIIEQAIDEQAQFIRSHGDTRVTLPALAPESRCRHSRRNARERCNVTDTQVSVRSRSLARVFTGVWST